MVAARAGRGPNSWPGAPASRRGRAPLAPAALLALLALAAIACRPAAGERIAAAPPTAAAPAAAVEAASVDAGGRLVVTYRLTAGGAPVSAERAATLAPRFAAAALSSDPDSGLAAWRSLSLHGRQVLAAHPISGPGSATVLVASRQPGPDPGAGPGEDLGDGRFRYTFAQPLGPGYDPGETVRVGLFLSGAAGSEATSATYDFVPSGGPPEQHETVLDARCKGCHAAVSAHGGERTGTRLCVVCHTYQSADPDTVDPAALAGASPATNPNPLDLGRLVHRIHRGKDLPTLYASSSTAPAPAPGTDPLPLPFFPGRNAPIAGARYAIVGDRSAQVTFGAIAPRDDGGMPARLVPAGVRFPRDLRDCDACHGGAPQARVATGVATRRVCASCHPDVWFGTTPITDAAHLAHPGGPQADDARCPTCHVGVEGPGKVDIAQAHVPPYRHPNANPLDVRIVSVTGMTPGSTPTVRFTVSDRDGVVSPLDAPSPARDATSPVARALSTLSITVGGSTEGDYSTSNAPFTEALLAQPVAEPAALVADGSGVFTYTFRRPLPPTASGTWSLAIEARRSAALTTHYTPSTNLFAWPYTGEPMREAASNPVVLVDLRAGAYPGGDPVPRRDVVDLQLCNRCHGRLSLHGDLRNEIGYCVACHAPDQTDWARRPKLPTSDPQQTFVNLGTIVDLADPAAPSYGTNDGIEERSVHFKVLVHRIHTGGRKGSAQLDADPFVVYGYPGGAQAGIFFEGKFPNDLRDCRLCHAGASYRVESVPAAASPTVANETGSIQHAGSAQHAATEPSVPPVTAACLGCHGTATAASHAARHTANGVEGCLACHGRRASLSVDVVHGIP